MNTTWFIQGCAKLFFMVFAFTYVQPVWAQVNDDALMAKRPARLLSAYGLFADATAQKPASGIIAYDLQVPLFTDYAEKYRFVYVPSGQKATYDPAEVFGFPVGSVLVKTFAYPADMRKPDENVRLIETRLLIHQEAGWNAWAYVWNDDQTDAVLKVAGAVKLVDFLDRSGDAQTVTYLVPNKNQCKGCHSFDRALTPIGPKARNLNKDFHYGDRTVNQITYWSESGILSDMPILADIASVPQIDDLDASLNDRARSYLDINCAHCHRLEGPGSTSGLFLTYSESNKTAWGYEKRPVAAGRGSGGLLYDIEPGNADRSIIPLRLSSTDPGVMMPEVGRTRVHTEGLALIRDWINQMK
jgi:uncharacterized repeat protein (TIGR03806 family)